MLSRGVNRCQSVAGRHYRTATSSYRRDSPSISLWWNEYTSIPIRVWCCCCCCCCCCYLLACYLDHKDYEYIQDAIEEVKEIVQSINDELTEEENRDFLNRITANYDNAIIKANGKVKKFEVKLKFNGRKLKNHGKAIWWVISTYYCCCLRITPLPTGTSTRANTRSH